MSRVRKPVGPRYRHLRRAARRSPLPILQCVASLEDLTKRMRAFSEARDWGRFHDLKSLTLALAGEVGEVAELVQWLPAERAATADDGLRERLGDELADVLLYLVRLADVAGIDLGAAASGKLDRNEKRFPVAAYRSVAP